MRVTLRSIYAEREGDYLECRLGAAGALELIATRFCEERVDPKLLAFLKATKSLPAFLAGIQQAEFEKTTSASG